MVPAEIYRPAIPIPKTLWDSFTAAVAKSPQNTAYTICYQPANHLRQLRREPEAPRAGHLNFTYTDLQYATVRLAAGMLARGFKRGSTMLTFLSNGIERELCLWVSVALQLTFMPCDPTLFDPGREEQLEYYISSVTPHVVVVDEDTKAAQWDTLSKAKESLKLCLEPTSRAHWAHFTDLPPSRVDFVTEANLIAQQDSQIEDNNERIAAILYTSGTSAGKPKGCAISTRQLLTAGHSDLFWHEPVKSIVVYSSNYRAMATWHTFIYLQNNFRVVFPSPTVSIPALLNSIEECHVESAILMPYMVHVFSQDPKFVAGQRNLQSMKSILLGGDVITTDMVERASKIFPNAKVRGGYGMSEAIACLTMKGFGDHPQPTFGKIVSGGVPGPATLVRICDEHRKILDRGQLGEVHFGGPNVMRRYWQNVQPESFYEDEKGHWILTGDRGFMDEEGFIFIVGRSKDIIKRKGMVISPAVIMSTLNRCPGVHATVFGMHHEINGETIVAVIENDASYDTERIKSIVEKALGIEYALDEVYTLGDLAMHSFPIGPTGKIPNLALKQAILSYKK